MKKFRTCLNMSSIVLTVTGCIIGGVTLNPIILRVLTGAGVIIQGYATQSKLNSEVEDCKFASTTYDKILTQLRGHLSGSPYDNEVLLAKLKLIDDIIIDRHPTSYQGGTMTYMRRPYLR